MAGLTLAQLEAQLVALKIARAQGYLSVEYPGQARVTFRSIDEMTRAVGLIELDIAQLNGQQINRSLKITSDKDL